MRARGSYIDGVGSPQHRAKPGFEAEAGGKDCHAHRLRMPGEPQPTAVMANTALQRWLNHGKGTAIMAQGTQEHRGEAEGGFTVSQAALNAALAKRGFCVHEGMAWGEKDGALFPIVAPTSLDAMAHGYAEFIRNRVVANRNGVSAEAASHGAASGTTLPGVKSNDAFDAVYQDRITKLLDASKGWTAEAIGKMTKEQKAERTKLIDLYAFSGKAAAKNKEKHYDVAVREAIAAGKLAGNKRETTRKPATTGESEEL